MTASKAELRPSVPAILLDEASAAAAMGCGATFFREQIAPDLPVIRRSAKRLYAVEILRAWALEHSELVLPDREASG